MRITLSEQEISVMVSDWVSKNMVGWDYEDSAINDGEIEVAVGPEKMAEDLTGNEEAIFMKA